MEEAQESETAVYRLDATSFVLNALTRTVFLLNWV